MDNTTYTQLIAIVDALDNKFPNGKDVFQRVSRLCEETGELAAAVNHREKTGIKMEKLGEPKDEHILKEMQDVMRAVIGIARHYGLEDELRNDIDAFYKKYQAEGAITYSAEKTTK